MLRFIDQKQKWEDLPLNIELHYPRTSFLMTSRTVQTWLLSRKNLRKIS